MIQRQLGQIVVIALGLLVIGACARTVVYPEKEVPAVQLTRPHQIVVYNFAVTEAEMREKREGERPREIDRQVAGALAEELIRGLGDLGFSVERKPRGTPIGNQQVLIDGEFLNIEEGNRLGRLVIGFGIGASILDTEVHAYYGKHRRKLLDFKTHADSGMMPGAAATMGAGAVVTGGVSAGMAAGSAATGAVKEYHSEIERMAAHSGRQAVAYLSEYFAKEGWIRADQVIKATVH